MTNPAASMAVLHATVTRAEAVRAGHLQITLQTQAGEALHGFGLSRGDRAASLVASSRVDAIGRLRRDTYGGNAVALRVEAMEPAGDRD